MQSSYANGFLKTMLMKLYICFRICLSSVPPVWGQGQKPGGPHAQGAAAKRSYPTSKVRGGGQEELPHVWGQGRQQKGVIPHPRSGAAAEVRGGSQEFQAATAQEQSRGATPAWGQGQRPGGATPFKERWLPRRQRACRNYSTFKVGRGSCEEIPHFQGTAAASLC